MYEKVNPCHPDKVADRIAGAIVDMAYDEQASPRIAIEVLIGHGYCHIIAESSVQLQEQAVFGIVKRIAGDMKTDIVWAKQDPHLAKNQEGKIRCGDNGIFKGVPVTMEQQTLTDWAHDIFEKYPSDGKYIVADGVQTICQSNVGRHKIQGCLLYKTIVNPLGNWTGGTNVDSGATNRKLGSDMGDGVTGGGLHGKDLSKADVSANIWCHLKAQETKQPVTAWCSIGDEIVHTSHGDIPYDEMVKIAGDYIASIDGFEKFAEWGLIRPALESEEK